MFVLSKGVSFQCDSCSILSMVPGLDMESKVGAVNGPRGQKDPNYNSFTKSFAAIDLGGLMMQTRGLRLLRA